MLISSVEHGYPAQCTKLYLESTRHRLIACLKAWAKVKKKKEEEEKAGNCNLATANMADYREHAQVSQSKWRAKYKLEFLSPVPEVRKP